MHVKDRAGCVGAIKEHFCSAGRCDDSFIRVPEEKREPRGRRRLETRRQRVSEGSRLREIRQYDRCYLLHRGDELVRVAVH